MATLVAKGWAGAVMTDLAKELLSNRWQTEWQSNSYTSCLLHVTGNNWPTVAIMLTPCNSITMTLSLYKRVHLTKDELYLVDDNVNKWRRVTKLLRMGGQGLSTLSLTPTTTPTTLQHTHTNITNCFLRFQLERDNLSVTDGWMDRASCRVACPQLKSI